MKKTTKIKIKDVENFLLKAFLINGKCVFETNVNMIIKDKTIGGCVFKLTGKDVTCDRANKKKEFYVFLGYEK